MDIRGYIKLSLLDYPKHFSALIFTGGCNFRCPFCYNPHLVLNPDSQPRISWNEIENHLIKRKKQLDGVVISGGEPLIQKDLSDILQNIKNLGYHIKLNTNGSFPDRLQKLLSADLLNAVAIDYKVGANEYQKLLIHSDRDVAKNVKRSIELCLQKLPSNLEVATTLHPRFHSFTELQQMYQELLEMNLSVWYWQPFHRADLIDDSLSDEPSYSIDALKEMRKKIATQSLQIRIRGLSEDENGIIL